MRLLRVQSLGDVRDQIGRAFASAFSMRMLNVSSDRLSIQQECGTSWVPMAPRKAFTSFMNQPPIVFDVDLEDRVEVGRIQLQRVRADREQEFLMPAQR
jgi:hypothetical protein